MVNNIKNLILFSHLDLGLPNCLVPWWKSTNTLCACPLSTTHATSSAHPICHNLIAVILLDKKCTSKFLVPFSPFPYYSYFFHLILKFSPQHPIAEHRQSIVSRTHHALFDVLVKELQFGWGSRKTVSIDSETRWTGN